MATYRSWHLSLILISVGAPFGPAAATAAPAPLWTGTTRHSTFVPMKDGTRLAVDWWIPTGWQGQGPAPTRFPVVFRYTPYGRSSLNPATGQVPPPPFFLPHGYAMVSADMRGTGASFGWMNLMDDQAREDGKELVDWITAQPWSDGGVGMYGGSYEGWSQLAVASKAPKGLKAIAPTHAGFEAYLSHPGGIYSYAFLQIWTALTWHLNRSNSYPDFPIPPTPPVIDEDGDGDLRDEIPVDLNGNGDFSDDYAWPIANGPEPRYPDGGHRTHHYYLTAVLEHLHHPGGAPGTFNGDPVLGALAFRDTRRPGDGRTAAEMNWAWIPDVMKSRVPILTEAGWFDAFVEASMQVFATTRATNAGRLVARPQYHQGIGPAFAAAIGADTTPGAQYRLDREEELRWFDHWLKGIDNGIDREPPVKLFVANAGWRTAEAWPPRAATTTLFLAGNTLARTGGSSGRTTRKADLAAYSAWDPPLSTAAIAPVDSALGKPAPGIAAFRRNRQFMFGLPAGPPIRNALEKTSFVYTSAPLDRDTDVIGHPLVHLWASSTAPDGDFFIYLEDVAPDGTATLVTDHQHRAGFHALQDPDGIIPGQTGVRVSPRLPWHGYRAQDYDGQVFADGAAHEIVTALNPTAWRFRAGHSIRLAVANADWPTFQLHPLLSPTNRPDAPTNIVPTVAIHFGGATPSRLELPVVR